MWDAPVKRWHKWDGSKWVDPSLVPEVWAPLVMIWVIDPVLIRLQEVQVYLKRDNQLYLCYCGLDQVCKVMGSV